MTAELALAIVPIVVNCISAIGILSSTINSLVRAKFDISERITRLQASTHRTRYQLDFLKKVHSVLDVEFREDYQDAVQTLLLKITGVSTLIDSLLSEKKPAGSPHSPSIIVHNNLKYAWRKRKIDNAIVDLENWLGIVDHYFFLVQRLDHPAIDEKLKHPDFANIRNDIPSARLIRDDFREELPPPFTELKSFPGLGDAPQDPIFLCDSTAVYLPGLSRPLIIDHVDCPVELPGEMVKSTMENICRISQKLHHKDPIAYGLLECKGIFPEGKVNGRPRRFNFVFGFPDEFERPTSLRARLVEKEPLKSLSYRFSLARDIAKAVSYVHTFGFVHKNIRPETILTADSNKFSGEAPSAFLVGFGNVRAEAGKTYCRGDSDWEKNLYRHGRRRGVRPDEKYIMQHDIYSLGVCLLEVGLWETFVLYEGTGTAARSRPSEVLGDAVHGAPMEHQDCFEEHLIGLARSVLPQRMGTHYAEIVETCLKCMQPDNEAFGNPKLQGGDGTVIGARFIDKVLQRLTEITV